jgi:hypothetical protein
MLTMKTAAMSDPWAYKLRQDLPGYKMDPKERFYRQFQSSVTGKPSSILPCQYLTFTNTHQASRTRLHNYQASLPSAENDKMP